MKTKNLTEEEVVRAIDKVFPTTKENDSESIIFNHQLKQELGIVEEKPKTLSSEEKLKEIEKIINT